MAKIDRSILQANDQSMGQYGDPDKIESSITHLADKIDENDNGFNSHKDAAELAHPDKSVTERKLADDSVSRRTILPGAVGSSELDSNLLEFYGDIAVKSELVSINNKLSHFERFVVEDEDETHASGYSYTSFVTGATFKGKEIYIARSGPKHFTDFAIGSAKLVAYIRNDDGTFLPQVLALDYANFDYRDPNLVVGKDSGYLILSAAAMRKSDSKYETHYWLLRSTLEVAFGPFVIDNTGNFFGFGNTLITPNGKVLKTLYSTTSADGGVSLFRSASGVTAPGAFSNIATPFPASANGVNECTIGYFGNKLVAIARQNNGNGLYRETYNLEGDSGWGEILTLPFGTHAPVLEPYILEGSPLILATSAYTSQKRSPILSATADGRIWTTAQVIDLLIDGHGGYSSLVKNRFGYGVMYYEEIDSTHTRLLFKDVDIERAASELNTQIFKGEAQKTRQVYSNYNNAPLIGNPYYYDHLLTSGGNDMRIKARFRKNHILNGIVLPTKDTAGATQARCDVYKDGVLVATGTNTAVPATTYSAIYKLSFPEVTLVPFEEYEFRIIVTGGNIKAYCKLVPVVFPVDFGSYVHTNTAIGTTNYNYIIPVGFLFVV